MLSDVAMQCNLVKVHVIVACLELGNADRQLCCAHAQMTLSRDCSTLDAIGRLECLQRQQSHRGSCQQHALLKLIRTATVPALKCVQKRNDRHYHVVVHAVHDIYWCTYFSFWCVGREITMPLDVVPAISHANDTR